MRWATSPRSPKTGGFAAHRGPCRAAERRAVWRRAGGLLTAAAMLLAAGAAWAGTGPRKTAPGELLGVVTDALGQPLPNAMVRLEPVGTRREELRPGFAQARLQSPRRTRRTGPNGVFRFPAVAPGWYWIQAGIGAQLSVRRQIQVQARQTSYLALPLLDVLRSMRLEAPTAAAGQRFAWVVRSEPRPALRWQDGADAGPQVAVAALRQPWGGYQGYVAFLAGGGAQPLESDGAWSTRFAVQHTLWGASELGLSGDMGVASAGEAGGAGMRVSFAPDGARGQARVIFGVQQLPLAALAGSPDLRVYTLNFADGAQLSPRLKVQYGVMVNEVALASAVHQAAPYARVRWRINGQSDIEYRFASATPPVHFAPSYAESGDPAPRLTLNGLAPQIERAEHQEVTYTDHLTPYDQLSVAVFSDQFNHTAVAGGGADAAALASGNLLPDAFNDMFSADGGHYSGAGARVVYARQLAHGMDAVVEWTDGPVLAPRRDAAPLRNGQVAPLLTPAQRQAVTFKWAAVVPLTHARLTCSYRWLDGASVTALDPYDDSFGRSDSYANVTIRQPLPDFGWGGGRVEALAEFHNLLAQGYVPILSADGHWLYLIQTARSFRGGLSINF